MSYTDRVKILQSKLAENDLDGLLVSNLRNIFYLTGFPGHSEQDIQSLSDLETLLIVTRDSLFAIADKRNIETVSQIPYVKALDYPIPFSKGFGGLANKLNLKRLGIEEKSLIYGEWKLVEPAIKAKIIQADDIILDQRTIKDTREIKSLREACRITDECYKYILERIKPGVSESELARDIKLFFYKNAGGISFEPIVAFGANSSIPHHQSGERTLKKGDIVLMDFGAQSAGYHADMTRTFFYSKAEPKQKEAYNTVLAAQESALKNIKHGIPAKEPYEETVDYFKKAGFEGKFTHGLGHGVGLAVHEEPRMPSDATLKTGMVTSVEPGVYIEGEFGIRIEDLILVSDTGNEIMTASPKELLII